MGSVVHPGQIYWLLVSTSTRESGGRKAEGQAQTGAVLLRTTKRHLKTQVPPVSEEKWLLQTHSWAAREKFALCHTTDFLDLLNFVKSSTVGTSYGQLSSVSVFV